MELFQVDAFTDTPFGGNPAGVCILEEAGDEQWMQAVAMEMNLPETAFLYRTEFGYNLRWFTPDVEMDLCGHATLAAAHILWQKGHLDPSERAVFFTKSGTLTADLREGGWIELNFPAEEDKPCEIPERLVEALGVPVKYVGKNRFDYIIEVESEDIVRKLEPNFNLLSKIPTRGFIVTSSAQTEPYDFVSRFFAPGDGTNEDPVTGSAHCCLAPYWKRKLGKNEFMAYQASKRGGILRNVVQGDRVLLIGQAVTTMRCELYTNNPSRPQVERPFINLGGESII
ncbi:MAG: PhzF family phenazine biosynthesis protein [Bacillota bacterium]|nr:PhzF family phenazine biosynthesis protein [Bacillota bacterium]